MTQDAAPWEPISLGYQCEVKAQLSRALYVRLHPGGPREEFERQLLTPDLGQRSFERHIFDWQITPFQAVLAYLESDFRGVFDREDLAPAADGSGEVEHRRLLTRHPHDFHPIDGVLDHAAIDRQYPEARAKFEHLAGKFRRLLRTPGRFLYVFRQIRIYDETLRLHQQLSAHDPAHEAHILYVGLPGEDQWLAGLEPLATKAWAPPAAPGPLAWEGDDGAWDAVLAPFALRPARMGAIKEYLAQVEPG